MKSVTPVVKTKRITRERDHPVRRRRRPRAVEDEEHAQRDRGEEDIDDRPEDVGDREHLARRIDLVEQRVAHQARAAPDTELEKNVHGSSADVGEERVPDPAGLDPRHPVREEREQDHQRHRRDERPGDPEDLLAVGRAQVADREAPDDPAGLPERGQRGLEPEGAAVAELGRRRVRYRGRRREVGRPAGRPRAGRAASWSRDSRGVVNPGRHGSAQQVDQGLAPPLQPQNHAETNSTG